MANLGWTPIQMEPADPPWGWNPAATFMTAFYTAQENKAAQEKAARDRDMEQILFPLKAQQTALELDKLQMEVERGAMTNQIYRKALRQSHSGQMEGLRDIDRNVSGGGADAEVTSNPTDLINTEGFSFSPKKQSVTTNKVKIPDDF